MDEEEGVNIIVVSSSSEQRKKNTHTRVHGDFAQLAPVEESSPSARPP